MTATERKVNVYHHYKVLSEKLEEMYDSLLPGQVKALEDKLKEVWAVVERRSNHNLIK